MHDTIKVETKDGKVYENRYCDYYVLDGWLTIFREEKYKDIIQNRIYYPFTESYSVDCVKRITVLNTNFVR